MNYKLICVDIDGTLVNDQKELLPQVRESLRQAYARGIQIALATGRMPAGAQVIEEELGIPCIKMCSAGTYLIFGDQCLNAEYLPCRVMSEIYDRFAVRCHVPLWIFRDREWFVTGMDAFIKRESQIVRYQPALVDLEVLQEQWEREGKGPNKLLIADRPEMIRELHRELEREIRSDIDFACSADTFLEIFPKGVTKGKALLTLCEKLKIDPAETIAFGDQELDLPMIRAAGLGIAMGNAIPELKAAADFVTKSNNEAGIAYALDRYLGKS